jgi:hypothetical protein
VLDRARPAFEKAPVDMLAQVLYAIKQLTYIDVKAATGSVEGPTINLQTLASRDLIEIDRDLGICAVPLYDFSEADWLVPTVYAIRT